MTWAIRPTSLREIAWLTTRGPGAVMISRSPIALTTCGLTCVPPFINVAYDVASWIGVTATPWPKDALARSISCHGWMPGSLTSPDTSPARSIPVGSPKPEAQPRVVEDRRALIGRVAEAQGDLRRDDVAGEGDAILERHPALGLAVGVVDVRPAAVELAGCRRP